MTMSKFGRAGRVGREVILLSGVALASGWSSAALAQGAGGTHSGYTSNGISDAQVEANVLKALASARELSTQNIQSSTVYGAVTLTGTVATEAMRTRAENLAARAVGVKKVIDELTLGASPASETTQTSADGSSQPVLQADGSYAPPAPAQPATPYGGTDANGAVYGGGTAAYDQGTMQAGNAGGGSRQGMPNQPGASNGDGYNPPGSNQGPGLQGNGGNGYPQGQGGPGQRGYGQPEYGQQPGYGQPGQPLGGAYAPQGGQVGGLAVVVAPGALLRVRVNRGLDSNHIAIGTPFDGTILSDVSADGQIAIPRGASVVGVVVDSKKAGALKGEGELSLQVTNILLGGVSYPVVSDIWQREGGNKTARTVNSALGMGALGAIIGGLAGGGAGAAIGAGVGAGTGVAGSAASGGGRVIVPPEAVLSFHLAQPATVKTVSEAEMGRLAYGAGPAQGSQTIVRRRYPYPYGPQPGYPYPY